MSQMPNNETLLRQIRDEYELGHEYMKPRRQQKLGQLERFVKQSKKDGLVNINMVYNTIDVLIASTYTAEPQVKFVSRDSVMETEQAETLNFMAKFDQGEEDYDQVDYQTQRDRYFFGLGIKYKEGYDTVKMTPKFYSINPMTAIFDPYPTQVGKFSAEQYRFFGFTLRSTLRDLQKEGSYDKRGLSKILAAALEDDEELFKRATAISTNMTHVSDNLLVNANVTIYHHMTQYEGKKWIITTDGSRTIVLRAKEIEPVLKEEKKDLTLVPRPLALYFYKPLRGRPLGISIPDLLEDKEKAKTLLFNANLMKARYEAFGGKFVVNSRLITNKEDILTPTMGPQYIFTNDSLQPGESLANVVAPIPGERMSQDPMTMTSLLEREAISDTKQDQMQMGIVPDKTMTKAEQQSVQMNANLLNSLNLKTYMRGDKTFRFLRWRTYQEYFSASDKKFIQMGQDYEMKSITITKDKFDTKQNPFIITGSKSDMEALDEKQKAYWNAALPMIVQDPMVPEVSKSIAKRMVAKLNGMNTNKINEMYPLSPSERKAKEYVEVFINNDIKPKSLFTDPNIDYVTFWIYFNRARDSELKDEVLEVLQRYMIDQGLMGQQGLMDGGLGEIANSATNIMQSQLAQQNGGSDLVSRDILGQQQQGTN